MDAIVFRVLAIGVPIVGLAGLIGIAAWSARQLRSDRIRRRRDRFVALALAVAIGLAVGGTVLVLGVGVATMDSGSPTLGTYLRYLPIGLLVAAPVAVGAVGGYAVLVRTAAARVALAGTALGAVAVIGLAAVGGAVVGFANQSGVERTADNDAADLAARSSVLSVSTRDLHVETADDGTTVAQIRVRVVVAATKDVRLLAGGKTAWPRFTIQEVGNYPTLDAPTPSGPTILAAGSRTAYDLTFETPRLSDGGRSRIILAGTYVEPTLGEWILRMQVQDEAGLFYELTTPVSVTATP
jgi:hypothetical protein